MSKGPWKQQVCDTATVAEVVKLIVNGATCGEVRKQFPRLKKYQVYHLAESNGLTIGTRKPTDWVRIGAVALLVDLLGSQSEVAQRIGCSVAAVCKDVARAKAETTVRKDVLTS